MAQELIIKPKILLVIAGPTAVGKTETAIKLARFFNTEIISADSRQFYREMNIGTAKPNSEELIAVKHHFINSHSISEDYNAGNFEVDVLQLLENTFTKKDIVILTGGSGLYIRAVCEGMDEMPEPDLDLRNKLNQEVNETGLEDLLFQLQNLDPTYFELVDKANTQRVVRALEVCLTSGKPYSSFRQEKKKDRPFHTLKIALTRDRVELYKRIEVRMDSMLQSGLLEEVKNLLPYKKHNALQTVGYQEIFDYLDKKQDWEETVRLLKRNSRRYAKRQLTWFRKDPDFHWFHPDDWNNILTFIQENIKSRG